MTKFRHVLTTVGLAGLLVLGWAGAASAHVEPDPSAVPAGEKATVAFTVEHGCEGEATTEVEIKAPDSVTDAEPVDKSGWTGAAADGVVTFSGGSQPGDEETSFSITFTAPDEDGAALSFPVIQSCGSDQIEWIQASEEDEYPAPVVMVGETAETDSHAEGDDQDGAAATKAAEENATEDDDSSNTPVIIASALVVAVLAIGIALAVSRGRNKEA